MFDITITDINERFPEETKEFCKIFIEKEARENILAYLTNDSLTDSVEYKRLWLEYLNLITEIQKVRHKFFTIVVMPFVPKDCNLNDIFWNLDYDKGELRIYEQTEI